MRFLIRISNQRRFKPTDAKALASSSYKLVREYGADVGNLRVSRTAVELDLLLPSKDDFEAATRALEKLGPLLTVRELDTQTPQMDVDRAIREGVELFNEERYWESHEALEFAWRKAAGSEKDVLQGIILVAAALVHLQKNEKSIALGIMRRAHEKLRRDRVDYFGVDVGDLREKISRMIAHRQPEFCKIQAKPSSSRAAA